MHREVTPAMAMTAFELYRTRQAKAAEVVRNRGMSLRQATDFMKPWAAIALLAGTDMTGLCPDLAEAVADRVERQLEHFPRNPSGTTPTGGMEPKANISPVGTSAAGGLPQSLSESQARFLVASDLCPQAKWQPLLAAERDRVWDAMPAQGDPNSAQFTAASHLNALATALGCKPYLPGCTPAQRKAA